IPVHPSPNLPLFPYTTLFRSKCRKRLRRDRRSGRTLHSGELLRSKKCRAREELARRTRAKREDRQDCTLRSRAPGTTATQGNPETKRGKNQTQAPENRSEQAVETH